MDEKKTSKKKSAGAGRTRNYTAVIYPDSAPENWMDMLREEHIPAIVSPLHDRDTTAAGDPKKAHYHVILCFDSVKTPDQAKEIFERFGAVCPPDHKFRVNGLRALARYMIHMDDPDKIQYNAADVLTFAGIDYQELIGLASDRYVAIAEMLDYCAENSVYSFAELLMYARINRNDWFRMLCDNAAYVMSKYLKSLEYTDKQKMLEERGRTANKEGDSDVTT